MDRRQFMGFGAGAATLLASGRVGAASLEKISIVVFGPPSLGAFLPPVIKSQKFDEKHGLSIDFAQRTPDAYAAQFNSGEFQVGGSAALLTVGLADRRGVKVTYLFNLFDYWGAVVTDRPNVRTLKDLEGKDLAAASGTTNFAMFKWLARQQGVDMSKVSVVNTATPGLVGYAMADRAAAVQLWEPAYTSLMARKPNERALDLHIQDEWKKFAGTTSIPYLGVAAHTDWAQKNAHLIPGLYAAYKDAAAWVSANPVPASALISPKGSAEARAAIASLIKANDRLGMNLKWADEQKAEIEAVYKAGRSLGYLPSEPDPSTIYQRPRT